MHQRPGGQGAHVHSVGRAERGERSMPRGALLRVVASRLGADRLVRVVVAIQLPVRADLSCAVLPGQARIASASISAPERPLPKF